MVKENYGKQYFDNKKVIRKVIFLLFFCIQKKKGRKACNCQKIMIKLIIMGEWLLCLKKETVIFEDLDTKRRDIRKLRLKA